MSIAGNWIEYTEEYTEEHTKESILDYRAIWPWYTDVNQSATISIGSLIDSTERSPLK